MTPERPSVVGHFDGLRGCYLCGWAFRPNAPHSPVRLLLTVDDEEPIEVLADLFRADLETAGVGDGYHAFNVPAPASFSDGGPHTVVLHDADTGELAFGSSYHVQVADPREFSTKSGVLDSVEGPVVRGWAFDRAYPDESVVLELLLGDTVVLEFETGLYRSDLEELGMGSGYHGFEIRVPGAEALTVPTRLHLRFQEDHVALHGSPVGYFNPGDILGLVSRLEKRLDDQEDRLMFLDYLVRSRERKA